jgi:hypothetical protein
MRTFSSVAVVVCSLACAGAAQAQNWSFDARAIGMGGVGATGNIATKMIDDERPYRTLVLPFGLIQVLGDRDVFNPDSDAFDPIRAVEYAVSPIHYVVGRNKTDTGSAFATDIRNARLSRDLNDYSGFVPANDIIAEGLAAPSFGGTIKVAMRPDGSFHGVYIGVGPYLSMRNHATIDTRLTDILASSSPVYVRNAQFPLTEAAQGQLAVSFTGGYRGRFAWPSGVGTGSEREGLYVAFNYDYLRGFHYDDIALSARLDTDNNGLLFPNPAAGSPLFIDRQTSTSGNGSAVDIGVGAVIQHWELGFGANGIGNHINWSGVERKTYSLPNLFSGNSDFLESTSVAVADTRVELPVDYRANLAYVADLWTAAVEYGHGLQGASFHAGLEERWPRIELRGGVRYTTEKWNPTGGVGFNFNKRVSLDLAAYGTNANIERKRQLALAASFRFNRGT